MLNKREERVLNNFNKILKFDFTNPTIKDIQEHLGNNITRTATDNYMNKLVNLGYCVKIQTENGVHNRPIYHFKMLKKEFELSDLTLYPKKADTIVVEEPTYPPWVTMVKERHPTKSVQKSARTYVGCSFNLVGW